jgi:hypothetical protein
MPTPRKGVMSRWWNPNQPKRSASTLVTSCAATRIPKNAAVPTRGGTTTVDDHAATTGFCRTPIPSTSTSTTSPG